MCFWGSSFSILNNVVILHCLIYSMLLEMGSNDHGYTECVVIILALWKAIDIGPSLLLQGESFSIGGLQVAHVFKIGNSGRAQNT